MSNLIGQKLGQYEILALLGRGGMAAVYRARQGNLAREVAVKVIKSDYAESEAFIRRFEREAQTIAALDHPHILKVYDYGQQGDMLYLVMELKSGGALDEVIRQKPLSLEQTASLLDQIAPALDYAHRKGIVHRDLKPQNILLDENHNAFLTDFGIAKLLGGSNTALTQSGVAMGTPVYMAPEQWAGRGIDGRTDIYALGIMLYEMITGSLPFTAETPVNLMYMHLNEALPSPRVLRPDLPASVERVIQQAAAKNPDERFQSAGALMTAFRTALAGGDPASMKTADGNSARTTPAVGPTPRRRVPIPALVGGVILLTAALIGGFVSLLSLAKPTPTPHLTQVADAPIAASLATTTVAPTSTPLPLTATASSSPTPPPNPQTLTVLLLTQRVTLTANVIASYTKTATPNAMLTAQANVAASDTANAIASFTKTSTNTATFTPSNTFTTTPTSTMTLPSSHTPTATSTLTPTFTEPPIPTTETTYPTASTNKAWQESDKTFDDGVMMVLVPKGCFMMGLTQQQADTLNKQNSVSFFSDSVPQSQTCFDQPFWIDKTDVTNGEFNQLKGQAAHTTAWLYAQQPRTNITWFEARDFCTLRGARLPSEAEWEYTARGPDGWDYPWSNQDPTASLAVYNTSVPVAVGSTQAGSSWVGALDMAGEVWQWTNTIYNKFPYPYSATDGRESNNDTYNLRVLRGGSFLNSKDNLRSAVRTANAPDNEYYSFGFRCTRS
jgi:serine/threonine-protein kinase